MKTSHPLSRKKFRSMQEVRESVHNLAVVSISKAQVQKAKNYDLKHMATALSVGDMFRQFNA